MSGLLRVTAVCTGNICRSPIAERVLRHAVGRAGLAPSVTVDSAGIGGWHVGGGADPRAVRVLAAHGYDGADHRVRQVTRSWLAGQDSPDLLLALDSGHRDALRRMAPEADVRLLRAFDPHATGLDVPDPYYGGLERFEEVLAMVEAAAPGVVAHLRAVL